MHRETGPSAAAASPGEPDRIASVRVVARRSLLGRRTCDQAAANGEGKAI